jgi:hypothetical protein
VQHALKKTFRSHKENARWPTTLKARYIYVFFFLVDDLVVSRAILRAESDARIRAAPRQNEPQGYKATAHNPIDQPRRQSCFTQQHIKSHEPLSGFLQPLWLSKIPSPLFFEESPKTRIITGSWQQTNSNANGPSSRRRKLGA